jgi:predicted nucleic acid-binding protein
VSYGSPVLLDNSVWQRYLDGRLADAARERFERAFAAGHVFLADPSALEILYSAQTSAGYRELAEELTALPAAPARMGTWARARALQGQLAMSERVSHRVKPIDLVLAAIAEDNELAVLHYDHDFDVIAEHTDVACESVWVAPRGSLG